MSIIGGSFSSSVKFCLLRLRLIADRVRRDNCIAISDAIGWRLIVMIILFTGFCSVLAIFFNLPTIFFASTCPGTFSWCVHFSWITVVGGNGSYFAFVFHFEHFQCVVVFVSNFLWKSLPSMIKVNLSRWDVPQVIELILCVYFCQNFVQNDASKWFT